MSYLSSNHPEVTFVPSDAQDVFLERLSDISQDQDNMEDPLLLNVFSDTQWNEAVNRGPYDCILAFNLVHLIPWEGTRKLFQGASRGLNAPLGILALYGAFRRKGMFLSSSDSEFDKDIKSRDSQWGLRDLEEVVDVASEYGFQSEAIFDMPRGNFMLILRYIS